MSSSSETAVSPMINLRGLSMHYTLGTTRIEVLRQVDLQIVGGQSVAVAGPSGSGKTSLLLLLSGLERPAAGRVEVAGTDLAELSRDALADLRRDHIGIIFQSFHLLPSLSALDNVALPLQIAGQRDALTRAQAQLQRVGLGQRLSHYPSQLSGGEQQRVAIARALVHRPQLLLADEPTGNLDDHTAALVRELLFELHRESGTTLVLVTHDLDFAARCDRVLHLHEGKLREAAAAPVPQTPVLEKPVPEKPVPETGPRGPVRTDADAAARGQPGVLATNPARPTPHAISS